MEHLFDESNIDTILIGFVDVHNDKRPGSSVWYFVYVLAFSQEF